MANLAFSKLGLKKNQEEIILKFNECNIEVKSYLPIMDKLTIITNVINNCVHPDMNYMNPLETDMWFEMEVVEKYTNLTFTEKQKEDIGKLYDLIKGCGLMTMIINTIPSEEFNELRDAVRRTVNAIYNYRNSALGILETVSQDYKNLDYNATEIQSKLADPNNMTLLKDVLTKLG